MTPAFTARRRAEEFHALVESRSTGALRDADHDALARDDRFADLLEVVGALRSAPPPTARPDFVADLRSRLMTEAESVLVAPSTTRTPDRTPDRSRSRERRLAAAIGGFAIVSATTSMAVAAQSALPGDTLYPLKRGIENAQVRVHSGDEGKGAALLENAAGRLAEVDELSRDGDDRGADISATLDDFSEQATEASELLIDDYEANGRVASLEELRSFTADSLASLEGLEGLVPAEARAALVDAAQTITRIDQLAVKACPACTDGPAAISGLVNAAAIVTKDLDDLTRPASPAGGDPRGDGRGKAPSGGGDPTPSPAPTPTPGTPTEPPAAEPTLPGGSGVGQPPAPGSGTGDPIGEIIDGLTGRGGGGGGNGGGSTGGGGNGGGGNGGGTRNTDSGGVDDLLDGLGDLLDGSS